RRFSKGYFGFDISGTIPFHRPTKWVQYRLIEKLLGAFCFYHSQTVLPLAGAKASSTSVIIPPCPDQPNTPPT
ncbi:hypothetical protein QK306_23675, partial [Enterobacter hormaechei]